MNTAVGKRAESGEMLLRRMAARRRRDNIVVSILAVLAVIGGGHAVVDAFSSPPVGPSDTSTIAAIGRAQLAGSFAREFVVTYLSAGSSQQDRVAEFLGGTQQSTLSSAVRQVSDPAVVFVSRSSSNENVDVWAVTVSVRMPKRAGAVEDRQFYRVAVSVTDGLMRALTPPAAVEPPGRGVELALAYSTPCAADTPLTLVAVGFLQALLTGSGDIARYTTPDSGIAALRPAPFNGIDSTTVTADDSACGAVADSALVLASVSPKADGSTAPTLAYPLAMIRAGGQWQVQSVDSVPALKNPLTVVTDQRPQETVAPSTSAHISANAVPIPPATQK